MPKKVNKAKEVKSNSDVFEIYLGTFIDNAFTWYSIKKFNELKPAYKEFKNYVNTQLKYTDEELQKVWDTGRLDIELRQGSRLLNWVGIYSRKVVSLDEKEEKEARKGKIKKDSLDDVRIEDRLMIDLSGKITDEIYTEAARQLRWGNKAETAKDVRAETEYYAEFLNDDDYEGLLNYAKELEEEAEEESKPNDEGNGSDAERFNSLIKNLPDSSELKPEDVAKSKLIVYLYDKNNDVLTVEDSVDADYIGDNLIHADPNYSVLATCLFNGKEYIIGKRI